MRSSYPAGGFRGNNVDSMWQAVEELRSRFEKRTGSRAGRGEVRSAVLALLAERPMHGYQIIREIEERSGGSWKPSAGSVYPRPGKRRGPGSQRCPRRASSSHKPPPRWAAQARLSRCRKP
jgi:hypothetical protein